MQIETIEKTPTIETSRTNANTPAVGKPILEPQQETNKLYIDEIETALQNNDKIEDIIFEIWNNPYLNFENFEHETLIQFQELIEATFLESFIEYDIEEYLQEDAFYNYNQELTTVLNIDIEPTIKNYQELQNEITNLIIEKVNYYFDSEITAEAKPAKLIDYKLKYTDNDIININYNSITGTGSYLSELIELSNNTTVQDQQLKDMIYNFIIYELDEYSIKDEIITLIQEEYLQIQFYLYWYMDYNALKTYLQDITPVRNHIITNIYKAVECY